MAKIKMSFFEKLTGAKKVENSETESMPIFSSEEKTETIMQTNSAPTQASAWSGESEDSEGQLTIDVYQNEDSIIIKSTIAGVKPEDLDVSINNDMVTIRGERRNDEEIAPENYYYQECYWGPFSRSIVLPMDVVSEKSEASLKNGILTIKLPKSDSTKSRKIQVRGF